ncbi:MAG: sarcosine oxidase subunit gamma SoxG [Deltaproteobacteria bacterium]|nr:sarcosine oxidase subunit gamma SoxG [Deltaproteobacteria bacterium]
MKRYSPVRFNRAPARTRKRNGWEVVLEYEEEERGPFLVDLSHIGKWDVQGEDLPLLRPAGLAIPGDSEQCLLTGDFLLNLIKWNWATIWHFSEEMPDFADEFAFTNVTEAYALLALIGRDAFLIMEKLTSLDLLSPARKPPFLIMGPVLHIRSQVAVLSREDERSTVLVACSRGYGQSMADNILDAGKEYALKPGGEDIFSGLRDR